MRNGGRFAEKLRIYNSVIPPSESFEGANLTFVNLKMSNGKIATKVFNGTGGGAIYNDTIQLSLLTCRHSSNVSKLSKAKSITCNAQLRWRRKLAKYRWCAGQERRGRCCRVLRFRCDFDFR